MRFSISDPRRKAALAAAVLFALGAMAGVAADRWWLGRRASELAAAPLTAEAMADVLDLDAGERARVTAVLDSLETSVARAALEGPASLQEAARGARQRLEQALPADRRGRFQSWMSGHHARMMKRMCGERATRGEPMMGPGMMPGRMPAEAEGRGRMRRQGEWDGRGDLNDSAGRQRWMRGREMMLRECGER